MRRSRRDAGRGGLCGRRHRGAWGQTTRRSDHMVVLDVKERELRGRVAAAQHAPVAHTMSHAADTSVGRWSPFRRLLDEGIAGFPFLTRFAVINLVGVALLAAAWAEGLLLRPYQADSSGMCYLITALFAAGLVAVGLKDW